MQEMLLSYLVALKLGDQVSARRKNMKIHVIFVVHCLLRVDSIFKAAHVAVMDIRWISQNSSQTFRK